MRYIAIAGLMLMAFCLSGCGLQQSINAVTNVAGYTVPGSTALVAANLFDTTEGTFQDVVLHPCTPTNANYVPALAATCKTERNTIRTAAAAITAGRPIRDSIEPSPGVGVAVQSSLFAELQAKITTIQAAINQFNSVNGS